MDKLNALDEFFKGAAWFLTFGGDIRLTGYTLKIEPTGYLLIIKAVSPEGPLVAFYGAETLEKIYRFLQNGSESNSVKWRQDQFALDKKSSKL